MIFAHGSKTLLYYFLYPASSPPPPLQPENKTSLFMLSASDRKPLARIFKKIRAIIRRAMIVEPPRE
jgi:hypothetical protein